MESPASDEVRAQIISQLRDRRDYMTLQWDFYPDLLTAPHNDEFDIFKVGSAAERPAEIPDIIDALIWTVKDFRLNSIFNLRVSVREDLGLVVRFFGVIHKWTRLYDGKDYCRYCGSSREKLHHTFMLPRC